MGQSQNSHNSAKFYSVSLHAFVIAKAHLSYATSPIDPGIISRLQKLQMHGLVNTDDETVVLRVWGNSFAMAIRPLSKCFMSS